MTTVTLSLLTPLRDCRLVFVDVETTGAAPELGDRVIEVGVVRVEGGEVRAMYSQLLDPQRAFSPAITALTGITPLMCCGQPRFADVQDVVARWLGAGESALVVGHNVAFDVGFLRHEFRRSGGAAHLQLLAPGLVIDTVRLARRQFGRGGNGLQSLARRFGVTSGGLEGDGHTAHRALPDALTTFRVMARLLEPLGGWSVTLADVLSAQGGVLRFDGGGRRSVLPLELEEALEHRRPVEMEYVDQAGERSCRVITPIEIRKFRGELILLAWCALRQERRSFKLARVVRFSPVEADGAS
ncbi:MAG: exonuclease domain-containing protein [Tepidisphaerales bacterium]